MRMCFKERLGWSLKGNHASRMLLPFFGHCFLSIEPEFCRSCPKNLELSSPSPLPMCLCVLQSQ